MWFIEVLLAFDRLFNALAGGDSRATISARVGYFAREKKSRYWCNLETLIDHTFKPIDGPNHCLQSMIENQDYERGNDVAMVVLSIFVVVGVVLLWPIIRLIARFR